MMKSDSISAVGDHDFLTPSENWRVGLDYNVNPGDTHTFTVELLPGETGSFTTQWQMLKEWHFWFGDTFSREVEIQDTLSVDNDMWSLTGSFVNIVEISV